MNCTPTNPVNGICDNNGFGLCVDGNPINLNSIANTWNCEGQNGGTDSLQCQYNPVPVDGQCNNNTFAQCTSGDPIFVNTNNNTWACQGRNGGTTDIGCQVDTFTIEDGECNNTRFGECLAGTPIYLNSINFTWTCDGLNGGTADLCAALPINGQCDNNNLGQCLAGNPTPVAGLNWNCEGLFGGLDAPYCEFTDVNPNPTNPPPVVSCGCLPWGTAPDKPGPPSELIFRIMQDLGDGLEYTGQFYPASNFSSHADCEQFAMNNICPVIEDGACGTADNATSGCTAGAYQNDPGPGWTCRGVGGGSNQSC